MHTTSFDSLDSLQKFISESSLEEFKALLSHFSISEIAQSLILVHDQPVFESKKKLNALFKFIDSSSAWERLGKHLSISQFLTFLELFVQFPAYQQQLSSVLIGLEPSVFSQSLDLLQDNHLNYLKEKCLLEPLHYHLIQFAHEGEALKQKIEQTSEQLIEHFQSLRFEILTSEILTENINNINQLRDQLLAYLERICTALSLVWHTDRIDLIEKLSSINEALQYQLTHIVGHPSFNELSPTGLYFLIEEILSSIFDSTLKNEDSALEGLTRLSIWHVKDYWEIGLLPSIHRIEELDPQQFNETERLSHHHQLFSLIQHQLERLQIETVGKLKKAFIFSKPLLKAYIQEHQHLLLNT